MRISPSRPLAVLLVTVIALVPAACGGGEGTGGGMERGAAQPGSAPATGRAELEHIHGLGIDPVSGTLYVATHFGLYRVASGRAKLQRIGTSRQDIMGFSVVGPGRFIGSGHPDPSQNLPPNLGLIESRDGGRTWKSVSLLGAADFHVLRSAGRRVYGFDSGSGRLMVSADGGRDWAQGMPPAGMFDLAIDPADRTRVIASTERGLFASSDAGEGWRLLRDDVAGLLAWPAPGRLFLIDAQGRVSRSSDGGKQFSSVGSIGGQPAAFASHRNELYAARGDGSVVRSTDGGTTWAVRATP
jgi:photosystem II stability/assembly factor-like uncharacterized protein